MKKLAVRSALFLTLTTLTSLTACLAGDELAEAPADQEAFATEATTEATAETTAALGDVSALATGSYSYSASNTNSAQQSTINRTITLSAGQQLTVGTCGVPGAAYTGDTFIRLFGPGLTEVASSDDSCGGLGSSITYLATTAGSYQIRGGCYGTTACTGTIAWTTSGGTGGPSNGSYSYIGSNTNSAQQNTTDRIVSAIAGQRITAAICGTTFSGDPYLRINAPDGTLAGYNDDGCNIQGATHTFIAPTTGAYTIRAGCFAATPCTGTVVWSVQ